MKTLYPFKIRHVIEPMSIRHVIGANIMNWRIPDSTTTIPSGDALTTEGGVEITTEGGDTLTTE